ncbi:glycosyltransferase family 9 protein [Acidobacteriota bacterium]
MNVVKKDDKAAKKILFLANSGLGDTCHVVPVLFALKKKYPFMQFEITFSSQSAKQLFLLFFPKSIGIIISEINGIKNMVLQLLKWRKKYFDYVVSGAHLNSSKTAIIAFCVNAKKSIGIKDEKYSFLYNVRMPAPDHKYFYKRYAALYAYFGLKSSDIEYGEKRFSEELMKIAQISKNTNLWEKGTSFLVAFANGADSIIRGKWSPSLKRIPESKYAEIFNRIRHNIKSKFIIIGSHKDPFPEEIINSIDVLDLRGNTSILDLVSVLKKIDLLICNDTGLLHIAHYCSTSYIGIFGPTDSEQFAPKKNGSKIIQASGSCSKCFPNPECRLNYCRILCSFDVNKILYFVGQIF